MDVQDQLNVLLWNLQAVSNLQEESQMQGRDREFEHLVKLETGPC